MTLAQQSTAAAANTQRAKRKQGHNCALTAGADTRRCMTQAQQLTAAAANKQRAKRKQGHNCALTAGAGVQQKANV